MISYHSESPQNQEVKIEAIKPLEKRLAVVFKVVSKEERREITKRDSGEIHYVCDFLVADETAAITMTLWNEDIDLIKVGRVYKLSNCFANVYRNSLRLSKGRFGSLAEDSTTFDNLNTDYNRSEEHVEDPRQRSYGQRSYDYRGERRDERRSSRRIEDRRQRW